MTGDKRPTAVITGASAGIGAATALRLAEEGFHVVLGARRAEKVQAVADRCDGTALALDVTDQSSVEAFAAQVPDAAVLVNNAGLASGMQSIHELEEERVRQMWETNVMGLIRVTQAFLPKLEKANPGHIVNISSTAGRESYPGGGGYTASKHAVRSLTRTMRLELMGKPVRVTEIAPGLVETEFSVVRFDGDAERAKKPYEGITPLVAEDIADCVAWVLTRPPHVNIDEVVVRPIAQAESTLVARNKGL